MRSFAAGSSSATTRRRKTVSRSMERLRRCQDLRIEAYGLGSGVPIYSFNEKGEKMYMEDAARERRLAAVRDNLRGCP
jgi:hypothetical protein